MEGVARQLGRIFQQAVRRTVDHRITAAGGSSHSNPSPVTLELLPQESNVLTDFNASLTHIGKPGKGGRKQTGKKAAGGGGSVVEAAPVYAYSSPAALSVFAQLPKEFRPQSPRALAEEIIQNLPAGLRSPNLHSHGGSAGEDAALLELDTQITAPGPDGGLQYCLSRVDIAGPGYINLELDKAWLKSRLEVWWEEKQLPRPVRAPPSVPRTVVIDYSSPNTAKEMHVGHLRSTLIGHSLHRVLDWLGHTVHGVNHIGDWGTQFGMLIAHMKDTQPDLVRKLTQSSRTDGSTESLETAAEDVERAGELQILYREAKARFDADPDFRERAKEEVVRLQSGLDPESLACWERICGLSRKEFQDVYDVLGVDGLEERGESWYNPLLPGVVQSLEEKGLALTTADGAKYISFDPEDPQGFLYRDPVTGALDETIPAFSNPAPLIIRKRDGGFTYGTTDLAAVRHRVETLGGDWLIYVTDSGQGDHFQKVIETGKKAGWLSVPGKSSSEMSQQRKGGNHSWPVELRNLGTEAVRVDHASHGMVLGEDGRRFRTSSGDTVRLIQLLQEAQRRARRAILLRWSSAASAAGQAAQESMDAEESLEAVLERMEEKHAEDDALEELCRRVGIGAVKYADLSRNRSNNYKFSFDEMLDFRGNTGVYLQYTYARTQSIFSRAREQNVEITDEFGEELIYGEADQRLCTQLIRIHDVLLNVEEELQPHLLTDYLFRTCELFNAFYEASPILNAPSEEIRDARLRICLLTAMILEQCFWFVGMETVERL